VQGNGGEQHSQPVLASGKQQHQTHSLNFCDLSLGAGTRKIERRGRAVIREKMQVVVGYPMED